ncbi:MAG: hypothetical protein R3350_11015, partial [Saprospiraceae bacterium]|nr:hypothetical protein [Saprospiraceae bacterium]
GIAHPEDMARFVILSYHRYLNDRDLELKSLVEQIREERRKMILEDGEIIHEERRPPKKKNGEGGR